MTKPRYGLTPAKYEALRPLIKQVEEHTFHTTVTQMGRNTEARDKRMRDEVVEETRGVYRAQWENEYRDLYAAQVSAKIHAEYKESLASVADQNLALRHMRFIEHQASAQIQLINDMVGARILRKEALVKTQHALLAMLPVLVCVLLGVATLMSRWAGTGWIALPVVLTAIAPAWAIVHYFNDRAAVQDTHIAALRRAAERQAVVMADAQLCMGLNLKALTTHILWDKVNDLYRSKRTHAGDAGIPFDTVEQTLNLVDCKDEVAGLFAPSPPQLRVAPTPIAENEDPRVDIENDTLEDLILVNRASRKKAAPSGR